MYSFLWYTTILSDKTELMKKEITTITTRSEEETEKIAENLAKNVKGGDVIALYGDLGAGKTTFSRGFARGLGVTRPVNSPTFIIMRSYRVSDYPGVLAFYHVDLYRIVDVKKTISDIGLLESIREKDAVTVIEWAEKMEEFLPPKRIEIRIAPVSDTQRKIEISYPQTYEMVDIAGRKG